ncbi:ABC transporter substrate-binding protein [Paenibacillus sepulcri]|uniref:Extracellular solute-binding protein n=1 Tax=Paenibacillus sepulcri TaxID=359917 RepID=A0ABS7C5T7_9BACL|nr:extracellular solute-binding protein [Paenibacillus sepulcri]
MRFKTILTAAVSSVIVLALAACSGSSGTKEGSGANGDSSKQKVNIVFWNTGYPTVDENNKSKKKEDFYIYQAIKRYETAHPEVSIEVQDVPSGDELFTKFQTAGIAKNGPDMTVIWSGTYMLRFKQFLEPLSGYFTPEEKSRIVGWDAGTEGFKEGGEVYGVPFSTDGTFGLLYNKKILADAGVDLEAHPLKNFNDFEEMLLKIKSKGVTPLGLKDPDTFYHIPNYWIAQTVGSAGLEDLVSGKKNFSDPQLVPIIKAWNDMYAKDLVISDQSDQSLQLFYQGQVAMVAGGNGAIANARKALGDDLGMMKVPDFNDQVLIHDGGVGGVGATFVVTNYSKKKQEAVDFIKFLMSKEEQVNKIESGEAGLSVVKDVDVSQMASEPLILEQQEWANEPSTIFWPDNVYPAELTSEISSLQSLAMTGKMTAEEFMGKIDQKRDELLKSSR